MRTAVLRLEAPELASRRRLGVEVLHGQRSKTRRRGRVTWPPRLAETRVGVRETVRERFANTFVLLVFAFVRVRSRVFPARAAVREQGCSRTVRVRSCSRAPGGWRTTPPTPVEGFCQRLRAVLRLPPTRWRRCCQWLMTSSASSSSSRSSSTSEHCTFTSISS